MSRKPSKNVAIILARKNSKRIKNKNIVNINGIPLVEHSIVAAKESSLIDEIYVSSDCNKIKKICIDKKVNFILRSTKLSTDYVHSEEVLLDVIGKINTEQNINLVVFLQPTSPLRPKKILDKAITFFNKKKADSLFSSTIFKNHIWMNKEKIKPINYNYKNRQFEQEKKSSQYNENGSFYIFRAKKFLKYKNRLFGKITHFEIPYIYSFQLDEKIDIDIINSLFKITAKK
jgi:CMP-N,N'-diacetyllegionaminic acid synthase